jgi:hypothetical protein
LRLYSDWDAAYWVHVIGHHPAGRVTVRKKDGDVLDQHVKPECLFAPDSPLGLEALRRGKAEPRYAPPASPLEKRMAELFVDPAIRTIDKKLEEMKEEIVRAFEIFRTCDACIARAAAEFVPSVRCHTPLEWKRRDRVDGDPIWVASFDKVTLSVGVECEWVFGWSIVDDDDDIALGEIYIEEEDELDEWNYQHVERAQARCELVARALFGGGRE